MASPATSAAAAKPSAPIKPDDVLVTTLTSVPGRNIVTTEGFNCRFFLWDGNGNYVDKFQGAMHDFQSDATKSGANAVVNLQVSSTPFAQQGSMWRSSIVNLCGDEVKLN